MTEPIVTEAQNSSELRIHDPIQNYDFSSPRLFSWSILGAIELSLLLGLIWIVGDYLNAALIPLSDVSEMIRRSSEQRAVYLSAIILLKVCAIGVYVGVVLRLIWR